MTVGPDLLLRLFLPIEEQVQHTLASYGWTQNGLRAAVGLVHVSAFVASFALLALVASTVRTLIAAPATGAGRRLGPRAVLSATTCAALALLLWVALRPSPDIFSLFGRVDHLFLCALGGAALSRASVQQRKWILAAVSIAVLGQHTAWTAVLTVTAFGLLGWLALRLPGLESPGATTVTQGVILAATFAQCWGVRPTNPMLALQTLGLFNYMLLRHISFVVEARRGQPAGLADYSCYMLFYPSYVGATEIYSEFVNRNFVRQAPYDYRRAVSKVFWGQLQLWLALQIPASFDWVLRSAALTVVWPRALVLFARSALFVMGQWHTIEALALLYGIELRPNFPGTVYRENPSQFWRAWRGTMTNWLIHYVYIPLGGNRRKQARNIFAAFAVTVLWHWMGIPFFSMTLKPLDFGPVALWGILNGTAVVAYVYARRRDWQILPAGTPIMVRRATKIVLTACLGTFTVTLLAFLPSTTDQFLPFLRSLVGLPQ